MVIGHWSLVTFLLVPDSLSLVALFWSLVAFLLFTGHHFHLVLDEFDKLNLNLSHSDL